MRHFLMNTTIAVFQLKRLISKTPGLEIFKMWSTIFVSSKIIGDIAKFVNTNFNLLNQNCLIYNIYVNF